MQTASYLYSTVQVLATCPAAMTVASIAVCTPTVMFCYDVFSRSFYDILIYGFGVSNLLLFLLSPNGGICWGAVANIKEVSYMRTKTLSFFLPRNRLTRAGPAACQRYREQSLESALFLQLVTQQALTGSRLLFLMMCFHLTPPLAGFP